MRPTSILGIIFCLTSLLTANAAPTNTPPTGTITGRQGSNTEGSASNPFNGTGIALNLQVVDPDGDPHTAIWQAGWSGSFCTLGTFQWFGVENFTPFFVHPPVRSGVARINIVALVDDGVNQLVEVTQTFHVVPSADNVCDAAPPGGGGGIRGVDLQPDAPTADLGQTINLTGQATADEPSLTFLYYVSSSAQSAVGTLFATKPASGCQNGCSTQATFTASNTPTTHFFKVEVRDSTDSVFSPVRAVQVLDGGGVPPGGGGGGGGGGGDGGGGDVRTWTDCQQCGSRISAGPPQASVVGGQNLDLVGDAVGPVINGSPIIGSFRWLILDDGGLGSDLRILNAPSFNAVLRTPVVSADVEVRLGFEGTFNTCACMDAITVTILAEAPPAADIQVVAAGLSQIEVGQDAVYQLDVTNQGPDTAGDVTLTALIPNGLLYRSAVSSRGSCFPSNNLLTCRMGDFGNGTQGRVTLTTQGEQPGDVVLNVSIVSSQSDPNTGDNEAQAITSIIAPASEADLKVSLSGPDELNMGATDDFRVDITNQGPDSAEDVALNVTWTSRLKVAQVVTADGDCQVEASSSQCALGTFASGQVKTVSLMVNGDQAGTALIDAAVSKPDGSDPVSLNNQAQAAVNVAQPQVNLKLSLAPGDETLLVGSEKADELTVTNQSEVTATGVVLRHRLPDEAEFVAADPSQGECSFDSATGEVVCQLGEIAGGGESHIRVVCRHTKTGEATTSASVISSEGDIDPSDNQVTSTVSVVEGQADLAVQLRSTSNQATRDAPFTYTILVVNHGPQEASTVTLRATVPVGFALPEVTTEKGSCSLSEEMIDCDLGRLAVDEEVTVVIGGRVEIDGTLTKTVVVSSDVSDPIMENNEDSLVTEVLDVEFAMLPFSVGIPNTFVGLAMVNLADGANAIEIQALDPQGVLRVATQVDSSQSLRQEALLTTQFFADGEVVEEDTLVARGLSGVVRSFFMVGDFDLVKIDGIGGRMPDSKNLYFPLVRNQNGSKTVFFLYNPSVEPTADVLLELFDAEGVQLSSATVSLGARGSLRADVSEIFGSVELSEGYMKVSSESRVRGFELVDDGNDLTTVTGRPDVSTRRLTVPHFVNFPGATTVLRLLNTSELQAGGMVEVFDDQGQLVAQAPFEIGARSMGVFDLQELFAGEDIGSTGYLVLQLSGGTVGPFATAADIAATVSYQGERFQAALPIVETGFNRTYFLHVAQNELMFHGLAVLNDGSQPATGTVEVFNAAGESTGLANFTLAPGQRMVSLLNEEALFGPGFTQVQGHLQINSDQAVMSFALFGGADFLAAIEGQGVVLSDPQ